MFSLLEAHVVAYVLSNVAVAFGSGSLRVNVWVRQFYVLMGEPLLLTFANFYTHHMRGNQPLLKEQKKRGTPLIKILV